MLYYDKISIYVHNDGLRIQKFLLNRITFNLLGFGDEFVDGTYSKLLLVFDFVRFNKAGVFVLDQLAKSILLKGVHGKAHTPTSVHP